MTTYLPRRAARLALAALAALFGALPLAAQRVERFTLDARGANVHNVAGVVTVVPGTGSAVVVEITRGGADAAQLRVVRDGGEVRVVYPGNRVLYERMGARARSTVMVRRNGRLGSGISSRAVVVAGAGAGTRAWADVRVLVPAGRSAEIHQSVGRVSVANVNGRVQVFAHTADIDVRNTQGDLTVDTQTGAVTLTNVRGGTVDAAARSGSIRGTGVRAQALEALVGSGPINLTGVSAREVTADTRAGSVDLVLATDADLEVRTGSGPVTVTLPRTYGAQVEIEAGNGGITVDGPVANRRATRSTFQGTLGDGRGSLAILTGSGAVRIRRS
jgi:hypothetical protein